MSNDYSENILIQESAGHLLEQELGWEVATAHNSEKLGEDGTFGRRSYQEILLVRYFKAALKRLNPWLTALQVEEAQKKLESRLSSSSLLQINEEKYFLIRDGIPVTVRKANGKTEEKRAAVIDFQNPANNHFLAIKELKINGSYHRRRADLIGFVNGLPLLFMEFKSHAVDVQNAYTDNYCDYLDTIPQLFYYNAFLLLSNGVEAKVGTLGSKYEFFHDWKRLQEDEAGKVDLEIMLRGLCSRENFLDLLENFILYDHSGGHTSKILARNHQYLGVNEAVKAYAERELRAGKLGVFWHTQGSGKSYSMAFLSQKIRRKFSGSPTIVILTDREELNTQISDTFENCGLLGKTKATQFIAGSGADLVQKLQGNPSFIFTLIQKFNQPNPTPIYPEHDIIIMSDEAHRSQYGTFAENMNQLLPTAAKIGFTGTPLLANDNITQRTFGGYLSVYDFKRAVEDGATVPLYYENRAAKISQLENPEITDRILAAIEAADLDADQQEKLEREFAKEIHILTAEPRLRAVAQDFVRHYSDLWTSGKAMLICLNKVTCVRMYNYVQEYWAAEITKLQAEIQVSDPQEVSELERKLAWMQETEMAVVISQEQNEIQHFKKWGLDILPHRLKLEKRELDKEFKDAQNPFRVVFVCAMWLTGFDVKSLSCLYLDKPLQAHSLMQAIARANRVAEGKSNGLIIDYIGIVKALRQALADYTANKAQSGGTDPTIDKKQLLDRIQELLAIIKDFLDKQGFSLPKLLQAADFKKLALVQTAANAICGSLETKKTYQTYAAELFRLLKYADREEIDADTGAAKNAIMAIYNELQKKRKKADKVNLLVQINEIVSEYIQIEQSAPETEQSKQFDLSKIDFELLHQEFVKSQRKNLILQDLEYLVQSRLENMLLANPGRINYYQRYQEIILAYNGERDRTAIEKTFLDLVELASQMDREQQRYVREGFSSEEELALYDLLFSENLSAPEIKKLKEIAVDLLQKVKAKIAELDHWTDKPETTAIVHNLIRNTLWDQLPENYNLASCQQGIYEYLYLRCQEVA